MTTTASQQVGPINLRLSEGLNKLFQTLNLTPKRRSHHNGRFNQQVYTEICDWEIEHCFGETFKAKATLKHPLSGQLAAELHQRYAPFFTFCDQHEFSIKTALHQGDCTEIYHVLIHGQLALYIFVRALRDHHGEKQPPF